MKIKIFEINTDAPGAIENEINSFLEDNEFSHLEFGHVAEFAAPRKGMRIMLIYEFANSEELVEA